MNNPRLFRILPELADDSLSELEFATAAANLESFAVAIQHGMHNSFAPPLAAKALARRLAWTDVSLDVLVRAYRLGHEWLYEDIRRFCATECSDSDTAVELLGELGQLAFRFTDASTTSVIAEYERERETLLRSDLAERHSHIRAVLSDNKPIFGPRSGHSATVSMAPTSPFGRGSLTLEMTPLAWSAK